MGASPHKLCLDDLISAALARGPLNQTAFEFQTRRYGLTVIRAIAPDMPADQREEVLNEGIFYLLAGGERGWTRSGRTATAYFNLCLLRGLRRVRASYAPPGQPTRAARRTKPQPSEAMHTRPIPPVEDHADPNADADFAAADIRHDAAEILAQARGTVKVALQLICFDDLDIKAAAQLVGLSRQALYRRIDDFARPYREAA